MQFRILIMKLRMESWSLGKINYLRGSYRSCLRGRQQATILYSCKVKLSAAKYSKFLGLSIGSWRYLGRKPSREL